MVPFTHHFKVNTSGYPFSQNLLRPRTSFPLFDHDTNTLASLSRMAVKHITNNADVIDRGVVQLHLEFSEDRGDCQKYLGLGESENRC